MDQGRWRQTERISKPMKTMRGFVAGLRSEIQASARLAAP